MCLYADQHKPLIATEDIVCYKYLRKAYYVPTRDGMRRPNFNFYSTPCTNTKLCRKDKIIGHVQRDPWWERPLKLFTEDTIIEGGAIHTYNDLTEMARCHMVGRLHYVEKDKRYDDNLAYFKCVIPKGTKYWTDSCNKQYASKKIVYKEELNLEAIDELTEYYESIYGKPMAKDEYDAIVKRERLRKAKKVKVHNYKKKRKRAAKKR